MISINELKKYEKEIIEFRRDFHKHPELGFEETRTSDIVAHALKSWGLEVETGVGKTGVIGTLKGKSDGKTVALRADMDALPLQEENENISYKSTRAGKMHACGHDAHTAMLLGAAHVLSENLDKLKGTVKFVFQPAEEGPAPGGGSLVVESGVLENVDETLALHVGPMDIGSVSIHAKEASASTDYFEIKIIGKGGHGAGPHMTVDPIIVAAQVICNLQNIVSREIDATESAVISIGSIHGGEAFNVIPEEVKMVGTVRTLNEDIREMVFERMDAYVNGITSSFGAKYELVRGKGYPSLINDEKVVERVRQIGIKLLGEDKVEIAKKPLMGGEDFAYYTQKVPGVIAWLGSANNEKGIMAIPHNPKFDIDEDCLVIGTGIHVNFALDVLNN